MIKRGKLRGKNPRLPKRKDVSVFFPFGAYALIFFPVLFLTACSFDYNSGADSDEGKPDIVMQNLEYVRIRGGDPLVRFRAEYAERWEENQTMELRNFTFEQMEDFGETVNAGGRAGAASIELDSGNTALSSGVRISVDSEDIVIRTAVLDWKDKEKTLTGGVENEVEIERSDGTSFTGRGFFADARNRTWTFSGEVKGIYVEEDEEEESDDEEGAAITDENGEPVIVHRQVAAERPVAVERPAATERPPAETARPSASSGEDQPVPSAPPEAEQIIPAEEK